MAITYTTRDIEADFSSIIERVREGETVAIAHKGEVVAEIRPIERRKYTIEERLGEMRRKGILAPSVPPGKPKRPLRLGKPSPGALERFLADRD